MASNDAHVLFQCSDCSKCFESMTHVRDHECSGGGPGSETEHSQSGQNTSVDSPGTSIEADGTTELWTRSPTLFLIPEYANKKNLLDRGIMKKKDFWKYVSEELEKDGYTLTPEQVNGKWKTLTRNYKATKDENKKSGSGRKTFPYEDMMDDI